MDARTFLNNKHEAALEELRAIEAEYKARREAAEATVSMSKKWLDELGAPKASNEGEVSLAEFTKSASQSWVSSRDLNPQSRHVSQ